MKKIIAFGSDRIFVKMEEGRPRLPFAHEMAVVSPADSFSLGDYIAVPEYSASPQCDGIETVGLRASWGMLPLEDYEAACKGAELVNWHDSERFCPRDGHPLERASEISKRCPVCRSEFFPRLNPAIVVLVTRGDEALLVHARTLKAGIHALVAGFVETGESLEQCVAREVREETTLEVTDIRYVGSQSWPFPHQLMTGFTARYLSGEVRFADSELSSGGFFQRDNVPPLPSLPSLSRRIIDAWIEGKLPAR